MTAAVIGAPALFAQKSPSEVIGVACIGVGTQGHYLMQYLQQVPDTEIRIICDLYEGNRNRGRTLCYGRMTRGPLPATISDS